MLPYEWHGSGPPLLLLAGLGAKGTSFHPFLDAAAERYRVLTCDLRGSGRARALEPGSTLRDLAADVAELLAALDVGPLPVIGRSMGGMVAQELALLAPDQLEVMVLASSTAYADAHLAEIFRLLADMSSAGIPAELRHRSSLLWALGPAALAERESVRRYLEARVHNDRPRDYAIQALACAAHDTRARLRSVEIPTLVLAGSEDRFMPARHALGLARALPHAELRFVPGAGHLAYLEEPELFAEAVFEFLERRCARACDATSDRAMSDRAMSESVEVPLTREGAGTCPHDSTR
jgi:3-oxoadipate enol-lactonase